MITRLPFFGAMLLVVAVMTAHAQHAPASFDSLPKGVVLEGSAEGMEAVKSVTYDKDKNTFTINGKLTYTPPIDGKYVKNLVKGLSKSDLLGISLLTDGSTMTYGEVKSGDVRDHLLRTDKLLAGVLWGDRDWIGDIKLPGDYKPKAHKDRKIPIVVVFQITGFSFVLKNDTEYVRAGANLIISMIPRSEKRAEDGGFLPADEETRLSYKPPIEDAENLEHLNANKLEYYKIDCMAKSLAYGEVAAFIRHLIENKVDLDKLLEQF